MKNLLRELRDEHGWSQAEVAKRIGVSRQAFNSLETGKTVPSLLLAFRLSWLFGKTVEEVFTVELEEKMTLCNAAWEYQDRMATAFDEVGVLESMGESGWEMDGFGPMVIHFRRPEHPELRVEWEYKRLSGPMLSATRRALEEVGWIYCGSWMAMFHYFKRQRGSQGRSKPLGIDEG